MYEPHSITIRLYVLSNCQRHVKLCQKRSAKVISPGDEDAGTDSTAGPSSSSFITYPPEPTEDSSRRSNEVPIRPKPASSHGSGSSLAGVGPAALERSASVGSSGVMEGEGVVKSEPLGYSYSAGYEQASGSGSGFGYDESGSTYEPVRAQFEPQQTIYEEPASDLVNRALEPEVKHENEEGGDVWTQTQAFPSAHPGGYHQPWSDSASGAGGFHQYGPDPGTSASTATEQHQSIANGYSYPQQPQPQLQQQLYGQQPAGFTPQHMTEQSPDGYSTAYANPSSSYPGPLEPEVGVKHYSGYSWAGAGSPWNGQPGYNS
ncbi:hypothetical protein FRC07_004679 [Ceratobasidium sp. 392]|nr:hypothetical protein FRC07_004679 [Ceratobasidium sp. 392]